MGKKRSLKFQYRVFIGSIAVIILIGVFAVQYSVRKQDEDARLIGLAGRQTMLCQRLTKLSLLIEKDHLQRSVKSYRADTLLGIVNELRGIHYTLLHSKNNNTEHIDSLLVANTPLLENSFHSVSIVINPFNDGFLEEAIATIEKNDQILVVSTQSVLRSYQENAEAKLAYFKFIHGIIALSAFLSIVIGLYIILRPSFKRLEENNDELLVMNEKLHASYQELQATEEEIRGNLEHIQTLQQHLESSEKQYRDLVENTSDIIYELDEDARFIYMNSVTEKITGFKKSELIGKPYLKIVAPEYRVQTREFYLKQVKARQEDSYYEMAVLTASGKLFWLGQKVHVYFDEKGWALKSSIIARDITELKATKEELEKSEKLYRLISNNSKDLISLYDNTGDETIRTFVSPSVREILGYEPDELIGKSPYGFIHPEDAASLKANAGSVKENGKTTFATYRMRKKDGSYIWLESYSQPFFNEKGEQIGFQTSARDVSQRKEAEIKLNDSKQKAEEATLAKSQFLSMMSHEIRTPMNAVIGLTNFLLDEHPREDQLRHLNLLKFSGENLLTIINDILDFSKIEAGKIQIERVAIHLNSFLSAIVNALKPKADDKGILFVMHYDQNLPLAIYGDPVRIGQVINNLISNAIKFTKTGRVDFSVKHLQSDEEKCSIFFSVKDTGIGIESDKLELIFDRFSQANSDTTRMFGGTGLGLAITKKLLGLMGSEIAVESKPHKGSEFSFTLSVDKAHDLQLIEADNRKRSNQQPDLHVLLVEDNDVNQVVATNYLTKWGYRVTIANNGKEALGFIKSRSFHVVLIDLQMPEMDGYEATARIRAMDDEYFKTVPIIALTASAMADVESRIKHVGINDYITKPFKSSVLEEKILKTQPFALPENRIQSLKDSLDNYSGANQEINIDLAKRMVRNIRELQEKLEQTLQTNDVTSFSSTGHKMATTLGILQNDKFSSGIEEIKQLIKLRSDLAEQLQAKIDLFNSQCNESIQALSEFYSGVE